MNLIEALSKYDKVTCDEIVEDSGEFEYLSLLSPGEKDSLIIVGGDRYECCLYLNWISSNSYREWKGE